MYRIWNIPIEICERFAAIDAIARFSLSESNVVCEIPEGDLWIFFSFHSSFFFSFFSHPAASASFFIVLHQTMRIKLETCITLDSVSKIVAGGRHNQMFPTLLEQFWEWLRYQGFGWKFEKWRRWSNYIYMIWLVRMVLKIEIFFLLLLSWFLYFHLVIFINFIHF